MADRTKSLRLLRNFSSWIRRPRFRPAAACSSFASRDRKFAGPSSYRWAPRRKAIAFRFAGLTDDARDHRQATAPNSGSPDSFGGDPPQPAIAAGRGRPRHNGRGRRSCCGGRLLERQRCCAAPVGRLRLRFAPHVFEVNWQLTSLATFRDLRQSWPSDPAPIRVRRHRPDGTAAVSEMDTPAIVMPQSAKPSDGSSSTKSVSICIS